MRCVSFVGLLAACGGCGATGDASGLDLISDQPLQGLINGEAWTYAGGETHPALSESTEFFTTFYGVAEGQDCDVPGGSNTDFIVYIPTEVGTAPLTVDHLALFVGDGSVTFNGTVRVDRIDDDEIAGGVYAILDDDNQVDGTFTISRCASE